MNEVNGLPLNKAFKESIFPIDRLDIVPIVSEVLSKILIVSYETEDLGFGGDRFELELSIDDELVINLIGLDGFSIVLGGATNSTIIFGVSMWPNRWKIKIGAGARLRFPRSMLKPVRQEDSLWVDDETRLYAEIGIAAGIIIDHDWNVSFDGANAFKLNPVMLADSGIVLEGDIALDLSESTGLPESTALGLSSNWRGVIFKSLIVHLPESISQAVPLANLAFNNFHIGSGGVTGTISLNGNPPEGSIGGFSFSPTLLEIELRQNSLVRTDLEGQISLPFFEQPLSVEIGIDIGGNISMGISSEIRLKKLTIPDILTIDLDGIGFLVEDERFVARLSGKVTPLLGKPVLDWPSFDVQELAIDSDGNVRLNGGWLNLGRQYSFNFYGFILEITKLGFGKTDDGGKWIGFSGGLKLVEGIQAGASVEGLRLVWYEDENGKIIDTRITFNGIGVEFEIPDALRFKGEVSYRELEGGIHRFDGSIEVDLLALDITIDGQLVIGSTPTYNFFAIYLGVELPVGIPLWATGLGLYGIAGLFALEMTPDKAPNQEWYEDEVGWYNKSPTGAAELIKWKNQSGGLALGGGITIGTIADNGFMFSGKMLLVLSFPGPILMLEGKANILKKRTSLDEEPVFRAFVLLDGRAGIFQANLDAQYKFAGGGELIDIHGGAEVYFNFHDASLWHLYIGQKEPRAKRIRAEFVKIFTADAYLMLDARQLAMGARAGYEADWKFGPLRVELEAWVAGDVAVSVRPAHIYGYYGIHGGVRVSAFDIGIGLTVEVNLLTDIFKPFHLLGNFKVGIYPPWPLPDIEATVEVEWGPDLTPPIDRAHPDAPENLPEPLKEVAIAHLKAGITWPLKLEDDAHDDKPPDSDVNVVPLDGRPQITFNRSINDDAPIGINSQSILPSLFPPGSSGWERIGNPVKNQGPILVRYGLAELYLEKWDGRVWKVVELASDSNTTDWDKPRLYGSWAPMPQQPANTENNIQEQSIAQTKLMLWSKTPFDHTSRAGHTWNEWFTRQFPTYPCISDEIPSKVIRCNFENIHSGVVVESPWQCLDAPGITLSWEDNEPKQITFYEQPVYGLTHALCFSKNPDGPINPDVPQSTQNAQNIISINFAYPPDSVEIIVVDNVCIHATGFQSDESGESFEAQYSDSSILINSRVKLIKIEGCHNTCLFEIRATYQIDNKTQIERNKMAKHLWEETRRWSQIGSTLEPYSNYRLKIVTTREAKGEGRLSWWSLPKEPFIKYAFFRTEGPPGLSTLTTPKGHPKPEEFKNDLGGLIDLTRYVKQTVPPTVPAKGNKPLLPKPVYRAFDVGVLFNVDYVEFMYKLGRRDLGLYLYDNNNRPARNINGSLVSLNNRWGNTQSLNLEESEQRWLTILKSTECAGINEKEIPHDVTLLSGNSLLEPDTIYEGRLVPLLLYEDFSDFEVGENIKTGQYKGWRAINQGEDNSNSPDWIIGESRNPKFRYIRQGSNYGSGSEFIKAGALLVCSHVLSIPPDHPNQPHNWTDYQFSVYLNSMNKEFAAGVIFRFDSENRYYRFLIDKTKNRRFLEKVFDGNVIPVKEDQFNFSIDQDYLITVECIGSSIKIYQDKVLVFALSDNEPINQGSVGLFSWKSRDVKYWGIRVEDYREDALILYRFKFITSKFTNFFHHLHSFHEKPWVVILTDKLVTSTTESLSILQAGSPSEDEARGYNNLINSCVDSKYQDIAQVEVSLLVINAHEEFQEKNVAILVQSPEPIDWDRTSLELSYTKDLPSSATFHDEIKLTGVTFNPLHKNSSNKSAVQLLVQKTVDLTDYNIEYFRLPGPLIDRLPEIDTGEVLLVEDFDIDPPNNSLSPSFDTWEVDWEIVNSSLIISSEEEFYAVFDDPNWDDYRIVATMTSASNPTLKTVPFPPPYPIVEIRNGQVEIGFVFRYVNNNFYTFLIGNGGSMTKTMVGGVPSGESIITSESQVGYWKLVRHYDGVSEEIIGREYPDVPYDLNKPFTLRMDCKESNLKGFLNDQMLFDFDDVTFHNVSKGKVGIFCKENKRASFDRIYVQSIKQILLYHNDKIELNITESPAIEGDPKWQNIVVLVTIESNVDDEIGILFRYRSQDKSYYQFTINRQQRYRRLSKNIRGTTTVLWEDDFAFGINQHNEITILAIGSKYRGYVNGVPIFVVEDHDLSQGQIGFLSLANESTLFSKVRVYSEDVIRGDWWIDQSFDDSSSIAWIFNETSTTIRNLRLSSASLQVNHLKFTNYCFFGDIDWTNYRVMIRMQAGKGHLFGVICRYNDLSNHYAFSMNWEQSTRQFTKVVNGTVIILWEDKTQYIANREYILTLDCVGFRISGYIDGILIFSVVDNDLPNGKIGLFTDSISEVNFSEVRVPGSYWATYYKFGKEEPFPVGTQVHIYASGHEDIPHEKPWIIHRFLESENSTLPEFSDENGISLRVVSPNSRISHLRHFLPEYKFTKVEDARILRKRDGTGFFLLPPSDDSTFAKGQYRMKLKYLRDKGGGFDESERLSQGGDTDPEDVIIDIPWQTQ